MKIWTSIKHILIGILIGFLFSGSVYAYRFKKPARISEFNESAVIIINDALEQLWNLANGRIDLDVVTSIPEKASSEGRIKGYYSGSTRRLYLYIDGAWRYINTDG